MLINGPSDELQGRLAELEELPPGADLSGLEPVLQKLLRHEDERIVAQTVSLLEERVGTPASIGPLLDATLSDGYPQYGVEEKIYAALHLSSKEHLPLCIGAIDTLIARAPEDWRWPHLKGYAQLLEGDREGAQHTWSNGIEKTRDEGQIAVSLSRILLEDGDHARVLEICGSTLTRAHRRSHSLHAIMSVAHWERGDRTAAQRHFEHAFDELSGIWSGTFFQIPDILNTVAWQTSQAKGASTDDLRRALEMADRALILEPDHTYAQGTRGYILLRLGRLDEAVEDLARVAKNPAHPRNGRASDMAFLVEAEARRGNLKEADEALSLARQLWPINQFLQEAEKAVARARRHPPPETR